MQIFKRIKYFNFNTNNVINMKNMFLGCSNGLKDTIKNQNKNLEI